MLSTLAISLIVLSQQAFADDCRAATWSKRDVDPVQEFSKPRFIPSPLKRDVSNGSLAAGDVLCRYYGHTDKNVDYYSCTQLASFYNIPIDQFFALNPTLKSDCSNIAANTDYCVVGSVQPKYSADLSCGPSSGSSCPLLGPNCCNSQTWKCGNSTTDCSPGICYGGFCPGDSVYTTNGKCGSQNSFKLCAGPWGTCCSNNGTCGTGTAFCGDGKCQSGNCTTPAAAPFGPGVAKNDTTTSPDGSCGGTNGYICGVTFGWCCNSDNTCGVLASDCNKSQGW